MMGRGLAGGVLAIAAFLAAMVVGLRPPQTGPDEVTVPVLQDSPPETDEPQRTCLADVVYFEARGRSEAAKHAVAHVVLNRVADPRFPKEICAVVRQRKPCQFSWTCDGRRTATRDSDDWQDALRIADAVLADPGARDPSRGALYFHARTLRPAWSRSLPKVAELGDNLFYTDPLKTDEVALRR
jgi:N-acetylmuramoyl-L-alanine amidase